MGTRCRLALRRLHLLRRLFHLGTCAKVFAQQRHMLARTRHGQLRQPRNAASDGGLDLCDRAIDQQAMAAHPVQMLDHGPETFPECLVVALRVDARQGDRGACPQQIFLHLDVIVKVGHQLDRRFRLAVHRQRAAPQKPAGHLLAFIVLVGSILRFFQTLPRGLRIAHRQPLLHFGEHEIAVGLLTRFQLLGALALQVHDRLARLALIAHGGRALDAQATKAAPARVDARHRFIHRGDAFDRPTGTVDIRIGAHQILRDADALRATLGLFLVRALVRTHHVAKHQFALQAIDARRTEPMLEVHVQPRNLEAARGGQRLGHLGIDERVVALVLVHWNVVNQLCQTMLPLFMQLFRQFFNPCVIVHLGGPQ